MGIDCVGCKRSTHIFLSLGEAVRSENDRPNTVSMFKNQYVRKRPRKNGASRPSLIGRVLTWYSRISLLEFNPLCIAPLTSVSSAYWLGDLYQVNSNLVKPAFVQTSWWYGGAYYCHCHLLRFHGMQRQTRLSLRVGFADDCCCEKSVRMLRCSCLPSMLLHTTLHTYFHWKLFLVDLERIYREVWLVDYEKFDRFYILVIENLVCVRFYGVVVSV